MSEYPECEKMAKVRDQSQIIGEFFEWLMSMEHNEENLVIARWTQAEEEGESQLVMEHMDIEKKLAKFFNIDLNKVEQERRAILEGIREEHDRTNPRHPRNSTPHTTGG